MTNLQNIFFSETLAFAIQSFVFQDGPSSLESISKFRADQRLFFPLQSMANLIRPEAKDILGSKDRISHKKQRAMCLWWVISKYFKILTYPIRCKIAL